MVSSLGSSLVGIGLITIFVAGLIGMVEGDAKKVVAIVTLSQLGFMVLGLGLGVVCLVYCHLLCHAFFKSCMFIQVGVIIHASFRAQDLRHYVGGFVGGVTGGSLMLVCVIRLCGMLFRRGFVR
jgi:NADH:ubiquinone oxidoreductase subunit 5 (subunit L)/multisubunit Na+/H+ antiporter MnhA subunit